MGWSARLAVRYPGDFCIDFFSVRYLASDCMEGWVGFCEFILYYDHPFYCFFPVLPCSYLRRFCRGIAVVISVSSQVLRYGGSLRLFNHWFSSLQFTSSQNVI